MIAIPDYGAGNLTSVERAVRRLGFPCLVTRDPTAIMQAERIIFPGVGAAGKAMEALRALKLDQVLSSALAAGKPILGICLGCQIILDTSEENGARCLGLLPGRAVRFPESLSESGERLKVPHMGWNSLSPRRAHPVLAELDPGHEFYFVHSYFPTPASPDAVFAVTRHGVEFPSVVGTGSLIAFQFHPEKSGEPGLKLLANFCRWNGKCQTL
ncbi:MAG: imidazole glycerol phosphate synthase subunit HisH [Pseudomonadota bacterium]